MRNPDNLNLPSTTVPALSDSVGSRVYFTPEFEVVDSSSISVSEIKSDLQASLARNGFSSHTIETAA
jgi:hypothetical protein